MTSRLPSSGTRSLTDSSGRNPSVSNGTRHSLADDARGVRQSSSASSVSSSRSLRFSTPFMSAIGTISSHESQETRLNRHTLSLLEETTSSHRVPPFHRELSEQVVGEYSRQLHHRIQEDRSNGRRSSIVPRNPAIDREALQTVIQYMGRLPNYDALQMDFPRFFRISVALWEYVCKVDHWKPIAERIKPEYWIEVESNLVHGQLTEWLFLALVFGWSDVFMSASKVLVLNCSNFRERLDSAMYLPGEVRDALSERREQNLVDTYKLIKQKYMWVFDPSRDHQVSLVRTVYESVHSSFGLDLRHDLPRHWREDLNAYMLLNKVEDTICRAHSKSSELDISTPRASVLIQQWENNRSEESIRSAPRHPHPLVPTRHSEAADSLSVIGRALRSKIKRTIRLVGQNQDEMSAEEVDAICIQLLKDIDKFREGLQPLTLDMFAQLRSEHIIPEGGVHELPG